MKTTIQVLFLCAALYLPLAITAQNISPDWLQDKHIQERDEFMKSVFVESSTQAFVVNYLKQQTPPVPNGPSIPAEHYLYAYDTNGNLLWSKQMLNAIPDALLHKEEDKFWLVIYGAGDIEIGNQVLTTAFPYPENRTYYFVEMDHTGSVLGYFTYSTPFDILMFIGDAAFDKNGDFILSGTISRPNLSANDPPINFSFGNYTTAMDWQKRSFYYVARMHKDGTPGKLFDYDSPPDINPETVPSHIAVNSNNGDILFMGRLGETLEVNSTVYQNPHPYSQLYLGLLDESLNLIAFDTEYVSTYGTIIEDVVYNATNQSFYFQGTWGDKLGYGVPQPLQGNTHSVNNAYLAKLLPNSIALDTLVPFIPQTNEYLRFIFLKAMTTTEDGSLYVAGFATDSTVQIGNQMHTINTDAVPDYESLLFKFDAGLSLKTLLKSNDTGNGLFNMIEVSNAGDIYCSGTFLNDFSMGNLSAASASGTLDALLVKFSENLSNGEFEISTSESFLAYPNPAHDKLNIHVPYELNAPYTVGIFDIGGRKISSHSFVSANQPAEINVSQLMPGVYFVRLKSGKESMSQKIIVR